MILSRLLFKNSDPSAVVSKIEKSIGKLNRQKRFISYRESGNFAKSLHCLLDTVESNVLPKNPLDALWLFALFIETDSSVIGQADDSSGEIGECYHRACKLLGVASEAANYLNSQKVRGAHHLPMTF